MQSSATRVHLFVWEDGEEEWKGRRIENAEP